MASPQKENGFMPIATELVEQLCKINLCGEESRLLWSILRKTYGWGKSEDEISLTQLCDLTGLKKTQVIRARSKLLTKRLITIHYLVNGVVKYSIQKDYTQWVPFTKQRTVTKRSKVVHQMVNKPFTKQLPTIDTIKDTNKDTIFTSFSNDVVKRWNSFCEHYPVLSKVKELSPDRRKKLKQRYLRSSFRDFKAILTAITQQEFLLGRSKSGWKINFDWLIANDTNYVKVLELKYKQGGDSVPESMRKYVKS